MAEQAEMTQELRVPLSKDRVLRAAIALADRTGVASLTMRKLAQELGVEAMSLYYYVAKKDEILDGMVELVLGEIEIPGDTDWKAAIRKGAISAHDVLSRYRWAPALMQSGGVSPARLRFMEFLLGTLRRAGFSAEMTDHAYHALDSHITGFTLWQASFPFEDQDLATVAAQFLQTLPIDAYPYLAEHIDQHLNESSGEEVSEFEFGLDLILDGLERMLV